MTVRISRAHYRPEQREHVEALMKAGSVVLVTRDSASEVRGGGRDV